MQTQKQIYIIDASAGTGKTYSLAKRYIKLLLTTNSDIRSILAITFTNKAAIEMKQRILELLKKVVLEELSEEEKKDFNNTVVKLTPEVKSRAEYIVDDIFKNYHYFQVQTIDSFINTIITVSSLQLNISPMFEIEHNHEKYLRYSLDLLIDKSSEDIRVKNMFKNFLNSYLVVENKKSWYPKEDIFKILSKLYFYTRIYGTEFRKISYQKNSVDIIKLSKHLYKTIKQIYKQLNPGIADRRYISALEKFLRENENKIVNIGKELSRYFLYDDIPVKDKEIYKKIKPKWKQVRKLLTQICEFQAYQIYEPYIDIFNYTEKIFDTVAQHENLVFLSELNKKIKQIVSSNISFVPELYIRLATRIKQCLIDEFQDTSVLQWENILPIVEEVLANGGTLFYVGDKKQSIYRFRGSDHQLFDNVVTSYFPQYKKSVDRDTLELNRRSKKEIVEFNNNIFSVDNLNKMLTHIEEKTGCSLKQEVVKIYSNSQQKMLDKNVGGYVYGELVNTTNTEFQEYVKQKVIKILSVLKNKTGNLPETAILVRDNKEVMIVSNWLLEQGFAVESEKTLSVKENEFVKELISLLKFLNSPFDNLSFASFILGKIFCLSCGISFDEIQKFIFGWSKNQDGYLYQHFRKSFPSIWDKYFAPIFDLSGLVPVYDLLIFIYSVFNLRTNQEFEIHYPFFYHILKLAKQFEEKNCSLSYFIERFDSLTEDEQYIVAKGENSVKVMTIHKSKGLEFDIVILPFVEFTIEVGKQKDITSKFVVENVGDGLRLVKLNKTMTNYSSKIKLLYEEEYKKILIDELNVLYVSFTRAKEQIYFFVPQDDNNLAQLLFPWNGQNIIEIKTEKTKTVPSFVETTELELWPSDTDFENKTDKKSRKLSSIQYLLPVEHKDWNKTIVEQKINKEEIVNREKIIQGEILHKILSYLDNLKDKEISSEIDKAIEKTKFSFRYLQKKEWDKYKGIVYKIVSSPKLKDIFLINHGTVFCEYEIVTSTGETKRVDRLIVEPNRVRVVDYKLYFHEEIENYKTQVKEYKQLLTEIFSQPVDGYILFIDKIKLVKI